MLQNSLISISDFKKMQLYMSHLPLAAASGKFMEVKFAAAKVMQQIAAKISKNLRNSLL